MNYGENKACGFEGLKSERSVWTWCLLEDFQVSRDSSFVDWLIKKKIMKNSRKIENDVKFFPKVFFGKFSHINSQSIYSKWRKRVPLYWTLIVGDAIDDWLRLIWNWSLLGCPKTSVALFPELVKIIRERFSSEKCRTKAIVVLLSRTRFLYDLWNSTWVAEYLHC